MFGLFVVCASTHVRSGPAQLFSEFIATFGLLAVIRGCVRSRPSAVPFAVGAYITAAYWFTASTSFANPAVTIAQIHDQHLCGDKAERCSWIYRHSTRGRIRRYTVTV
jgi:glycerol uptake facilitator-like aquaporin